MPTLKSESLEVRKGGLPPLKIPDTRRVYTRYREMVLAC
jgi:hypothetical protein